MPDDKRCKAVQDDNIFGMPYSDFVALPAEVRRERYFLPYTQHGASLAGYWKDCDVARCRRRKQCTGKLTAAQLAYGSGYHDLFPPCTRADECRRVHILQTLRERYPDEEEDGASS